MVMWQMSPQGLYGAPAPVSQEVVDTTRAAPFALDMMIMRFGSLRERNKEYALVKVTVKVELLRIAK